MLQIGLTCYTHLQLRKNLNPMKYICSAIRIKKVNWIVLRKQRLLSFLLGFANLEKGCTNIDSKVSKGRKNIQSAYTYILTRPSMGSHVQVLGRQLSKSWSIRVVIVSVSFEIPIRLVLFFNILLSLLVKTAFPD